jgi:hypothetical protein
MLLSMLCTAYAAWPIVVTSPQQQVAIPSIIEHNTNQKADELQLPLPTLRESLEISAHSGVFLSITGTFEVIEPLSGGSLDHLHMMFQ